MTLTSTKGDFVVTRGVSVFIVISRCVKSDGTGAEVCVYVCLYACGWVKSVRPCGNH